MRAWLIALLLLVPLSGQAQEKTTVFDQVIANAAEPAAAGPESDLPPKTFNARQFTLANGLQVVVIPNHRAPVVTHMLWYKVGAADEKPGLSGMAHYFEHLMFKGTQTMAPGAYSKRVRVLGGQDNAFTGQDYTAYFASVAVDNLFEIMQMEADRMQNLAPPSDHFSSEKSVVLEERRERTDNDPRAQFGEQLRSLLFINHPYATPVIGWMDEIKLYEWPHVKQFYDSWYAPNNAILVVSGDITAERLKPAAEQIYGQIPPKDLPARARPLIPPAPAAPLLTMAHASIHQPLWQRLSLAPTFSQNKQDGLALQVLEEILDGGPTTRLYDSLVVKQKKAVSVHFSYTGTGLDYGTITLYAIPADGVDPDDLQARIEAEIAKIIEEGVTHTEVSEAIARLQDEAVLARDSLSGPAMLVGYALATGSTLDDVENWPRDIAAISADDVQRVAKTYVNPDNPWIRPPVTGILLPEEKKGDQDAQ